MPGATRLGDYNTGHGGFPPVPLITASSDVLINGIGAGRAGDMYPPHTDPSPETDTDSISAGSATVFINGRAAARIGDPIDNGGTVADGSGNVFIGG
ncbi:PAAR domain-containing protein [Oscillospiraceae bacterium OttesenSCG-928-F05]|nr:PAAR domain-containing protein [Oscillospiraceae bacterium OttesenSCG-928-F05]